MVRRPGGPDRMLGVEEVGHAVISAAELAQHIGRGTAAGAAIVEAGALGIHRPAELGDVVVERPASLRPARPNACEMAMRARPPGRGPACASASESSPSLPRSWARSPVSRPRLVAKVGLSTRSSLEPGVEHGVERPSRSAARCAGGLGSAAARSRRGRGIRARWSWRGRCGGRARRSPCSAMSTGLAPRSRRRATGAGVASDCSLISPSRLPSLSRQTASQMSWSPTRAMQRASSSNVTPSAGQRRLRVTGVVRRHNRGSSCRPSPGLRAGSASAGSRRTGRRTRPGGASNRWVRPSRSP